MFLTGELAVLGEKSKNIKLNLNYPRLRRVSG